MCSECVEGYFVNKNSVCEKDCGRGSYKDETEKTCLKCPSETCWKCGKDGCVSCSDTLALFKNELRGGIIECTMKCPSGTRKNLIGGIYECENCPTDGCADCSISFNLCRACKSGLVLRLDNTCKDSCGARESQIENRLYEGKKCFSCVEFGNQCVECNGEKCLDCGVAGFFVHPDGSCKEGCPAGYSIVPDRSLNECNRCRVPNCKTNSFFLIHNKSPNNVHERDKPDCLFQAKIQLKYLL